MADPSRSLPTVEVEGPAGRIVINRSDLKRYCADGYELISTKDSHGVAVGVTEEGEAVTPTDNEEDDEG